MGRFILGKYQQTLARIGSGLATLIALATWFWPSEPSSLFNHPVELFGFLVALAFWILTEIHQSEEFAPKVSTLNDIRLGKEIIGLYQVDLRDLLKNHNTWDYLDSEEYTKVDNLLHRYNSDQISFSNREVAEPLAKFMAKLGDFSLFIATNTSTKSSPRRTMTGFKPDNLVSKEEYKRLLELSIAANKIANIAWDRLEELAVAIKKNIPNALD
jgi:hypothetical protein